jgi:hypothetical protein
MLLYIKEGIKVLHLAKGFVMNELVVNWCRSEKAYVLYPGLCIVVYVLSHSSLYVYLKGHQLVSPIPTMKRY